MSDSITKDFTFNINGETQNCELDVTSMGVSIVTKLIVNGEILEDSTGDVSCWFDPSSLNQAELENYTMRAIICNLQGIIELQKEEIADLSE
jgi:hypothetical protein